MLVQRKVLGLLVVGLLGGCGRGVEVRPDTGARQCVQGFYETIIHQDWAKGYAALDPQSQKRWSEEQFAKMARIYRQGLGFEPEAVQVGACEERDTEATGRFVLTGKTGSHSRRYKDAIQLRRNADGWAVALPVTWRAR